TGVGPIQRPRPVEEPDGDGEVERARTGTRSVGFDSTVDTPIYQRSRLRPADEIRGPAVIEEFGATVPLHPGFIAHLDVHRNLVITRPAGAPAGTEATTASVGEDPVLVEIVEGTLASVEREVETAIARTARSPMSRDAHDFRAGIHDAGCRKLTGRSYSALVHPVVRDFSVETMRPGDVFFHNDVYLSEGGIGHLPDLCVTVPVFHEAADGPGPEVVAFVQAFGHHDDIGGASPGSMPSGARSVFEEGLMAPPIRLGGARAPNRAPLP